MNALLSSSFTNEELKKKEKEKKNRVTEQPFTHTHTHKAEQTNKPKEGSTQCSKVRQQMCSFT